MDALSIHPGKYVELRNLASILIAVYVTSGKYTMNAVVPAVGSPLGRSYPLREQRIADIKRATKESCSRRLVVNVRASSVAALKLHQWDSSLLGARQSPRPTSE